MPFQIVVASGKGGTGKTTVAANLYHSIASMYAGKTLLVDCDVEEPNDILFFRKASKVKEASVLEEIPGINPSSCSFCRRCVEYCEFNAITVLPPLKFAEINASLCHSCGACSVACEHNAIQLHKHPIGTISHFNNDLGEGILEGRLQIGSAKQTMVIRSLKKAIPGDLGVVILDAPPGTSCPVVESISDADYILLVTEPTPFGLHDLKLMVELVREMKKPFGLVINKSNLGNRYVYDYAKIEDINILSEIPFSQSYASQYSKANLFEDTPAEIRDAYKRLSQHLHEKNLIG